MLSLTPTKRGGRKSLAMLKGGGGGHNMFWDSFLHISLKF